MSDSTETILNPVLEFGTLLRSGLPTINGSDIDELPATLAAQLRALLTDAGYDLDRVEAVTFMDGRIHTVTLLHMSNPYPPIHTDRTNPATINESE